MVIDIILVIAVLAVIAGLAMAIRPRRAQRYRDGGGAHGKVALGAEDHGTP